MSDTAEKEATRDAAQAVRMRYRERVEASLQSYQLAAMLARRIDDANINRVAIDAATLRTIGNSLAAIALKGCNRGLTDRDEKRRERLIREASDVAKDYRLTVTGHGDPRGYVMRLHGDGVYQNGWGEGFGVA